MSMRHFKQALESYIPQPENKDTIELKGPLSGAYSQALNEVFKRASPGHDPDERDVQVSEESAANDELMLRELARSLTSSQPDTPTSNTVLYGVSRSEVSPADVVNVSRHYEEHPDVPLVVIVDGTDAGPNSPDDSEPMVKLKHLTTAMESISVASGGGLYHSLLDYAKSRRG